MLGENRGADDGFGGCIITLLGIRHEVAMVLKR